MASPIVTNTSAQLNGASLVYGFATTLTDAQIKALPTTGVALISAPPSGYRIKVIGGTALLTNTAGAYTNINTSYCAIQIDVATGFYWAAGPLLVNDSSLATPLTQVTNILGGSSTFVIDMTLGALTGYNAGAASGAHEWVLGTTDNFPTKAIVEAVGIQISADNNGSGNFTGGNVANSLKVTLYYAIEAV